jgi:tRNA modification GTPase
MNKLTDFSKTIIALATALGAGSIAVIRVSGRDAITLVNSIFQGADLRKATANTIHFGRIAENKNEIDQVLVSVFRAPQSYTGEDYVEISCHANPFIVDEVIELLIRNGATLARNGEFTLRAFLNGKIDLLQAEAVAGIIDAKSRKGMHNNLLLLEGSLSKKIFKIHEKLIDILSNLELDLDFSEEEINGISPAQVEKNISSLIPVIDKLISGYNYGKLLNSGLNVTIIGKPNVGKSTLMNALLGEDRAITSPTPGTTRDTISESFVLDQLSLKLIDTAGLRTTANNIEAEGMRRTESQISVSDMILFMIDISKNCPESEMELVERIINQYNARPILVGNKMDLGQNSKTKEEMENLRLPFVVISAKLQTNMEGLKEEIKKIVSEDYEKTNDESVISNLRHKNILEKVKGSLLNATECARDKKGYEFVALDVREALNTLGEITGETVTDDILNHIFSNFCIGK